MKYMLHLQLNNAYNKHFIIKLNNKTILLLIFLFLLAVILFKYILFILIIYY